MILPTFFASFALLLPSQSTAQPPVRHLVVLEHGPQWPQSPDAALMSVLDGHKAYVSELFADGRALLGGPAPDAAYGILVLAVPERAEVDRIVAADPAVAAGVFVADVRPFRAFSAADLAPRAALPDGELAPLRHEAVVAAPLADVWHAWSTPEGAETFFAPRVELELAPLGKLQVLFFPDAPAGQRGAEDLRILAFVPERVLAFEWSAPPQFPHARPERTFVVVELEPLAPRSTRVVLLHQGFAEQAQRHPELAEEWRGVRAYFDQAWPSVLGALERRFTSGPRDWAALRAASTEVRAK
jgi:uncharacterized protein YndB with AHSA1/START domain/uncharacterized protein YciI